MYCLACLVWVLALGDSFLDIIPFVPIWNKSISSVTFYIGNINFPVDFIGADSEEITLILSRETLSSDLWVMLELLLLCSLKIGLNEFCIVRRL